MRKLIVAGLSAALAMLALAPAALAGGTRRNPGYARFAAFPESNLNEVLTCIKEVVEIQRQAVQRRGHAVVGIKGHPPATPNKQIVAGGINCYGGSSGGYESISATAATASSEICADAEGSTQPKTHFSNERKQLDIETSCRAVSG